MTNWKLIGDKAALPRVSLALIGQVALWDALAGAGLAALYTLLAIPIFGLMLLLTNIPAGKALDALLGLGAFAVCAGPFALFVGILPATLIGALAGLLIGLLCLPCGPRLTPPRGALVGLGASLVLVAAANLTLGPGLLRMEAGTLGSRFIYLFWLAAPSALALAAGPVVGWRHGACQQTISKRWRAIVGQVKRESINKARTNAATTAKPVGPLPHLRAQPVGGGG